jgi:hypothetical protein
MTRPKFQIDITGPHSPEQVAASDLAVVLAGLEKTLQVLVEAEGGEISSHSPTISLVGLSAGSERLVFSVAQPVMPLVARLSKAVFERDLSSTPEKAHEELSKVSLAVAAKGWSLQFKEDAQWGILPGRIDSEAGLEPPRGAQIQGSTTLLARCLRVGGVRPRAELRVRGHRDLLFADVTEEIARELGPKLYEEVVLDGKATWRIEPWEIVAFKVTSVSEFRKVDPHLAIGELSEAAAGRWDDVDAVEFVNRIRKEP